MAKLLYPPLDLIRSELFDDAIATPETPGALSDPRLESDPDFTVTIPDYVRELVARANAARSAYPPAPLAVGQLRALTAVVDAAGQVVRPLGRTCGVLLGAYQGGKRWSGWVVAQESDYATERDLVLEDDDGPLSPAAGMVQAWNPVCLCLKGDEPILGQLAPLRLTAVMALAEATAAGSGARPRPGRIYAWNLEPGLTVTTGSPLGGENDPRHAYRTLYIRLAEELKQAAVPAMSTHGDPQPTGRLEYGSGSLGWLQGIISTLISPQHLVSSLLKTLVLLALLVGGAFFLLGRYSVPQRAPGDELHRSMSVSCDQQLARVSFRPGASWGEIAALLREAKLEIAFGPSESGEVWLALPPGEPSTAALEFLKKNAMVEDVLLAPAREKRSDCR